MTEPPKILIADDEPLYLRTTAELLRKAGYRCTTAKSGSEAIHALEQERFDLVLSDLNMPGNLKLELLQAGRRSWPDIPLIVVTGAPSLPTAIESVRLGIADYLLKPVKYEDLLASVRRALSTSRQSETALPARQGKDLPHARFPEIIGESPCMQELFDIIERVAVSDANILITGESGTGKEVVAAAIHRHSRRAKGNLQIIDCTAIPETLFESVLFGHAKGSFTGAVKDQVGLLSQADSGSAFFDEIGELPASLQAKLLRVIQQQTFTPLGRTTPVQVDTRFLCATNRNLELEVNAGRFRRDLYYRLAVIHLELPPLRERGDDVVLLARHFLHQLQGKNPRIDDFSGDAIEQLRRYSWPGNIRELRNAVERALALARNTVIMPADLPLTVQRDSAGPQLPINGGPIKTSRAATLDSAERDFLISLLRDNGGNVSHSARQAGMSRQGFHKVLKKHGISAGDYRA